MTVITADCSVVISAHLINANLLKEKNKKFSSLQFFSLKQDMNANLVTALQFYKHKQCFYAHGNKYIHIYILYIHIYTHTYIIYIYIFFCETENI